MAVCRVHKTRDYTLISNYHLRDRELSCKACGLLSKMLSLPEEWDYTTRGLAAICKDGVDFISSALKELEQRGYLVRTRIRDDKGRITDVEYNIYETLKCLCLIRLHHIRKTRIWICRIRVVLVRRTPRN